MLFAGICLKTTEVRRLAAFYRALLGAETDQENDAHMTVFDAGAELSVMYDERAGERDHKDVALMFTVEDVDQEYARLAGQGIIVDEPPTLRPWGAKNMLMRDPDGNTVAFRSFPKE